MINVEYLVFVDNNNIKCIDIKSFEHLMQSDPDLKIEDDKIKFKNKFTANYLIQIGKIAETERVYFHLKLSIVEHSDIDDFTLLLKSIKSIFTIITKTPQTLYDGVSQFYAEKAYSEIYEIENLMRKLITKFMLINVGVDWISNKVPDDVRSSINQDNKDTTYLHNVDFIQLKRILFSEKYTVSRDKLVNVIKSTSNLEDLNLEELKKMIPISNWDRYFSNEISISQEKLSKQWSDLYNLRCKVAHNKIFSKGDYIKVKELIASLKPTFNKAIKKLDTIDISKEERENLEEEIVGNFSPLSGEFFSLWRKLEGVVFETVNSRVTNKNLMYPEQRSFYIDIKILHEVKYLDDNTFSAIESLMKTRNQIVHYDKSVNLMNLKHDIYILKDIIDKLKGWL